MCPGMKGMYRKCCLVDHSVGMRTLLEPNEPPRNQMQSINGSRESIKKPGTYKSLSTEVFQLTVMGVHAHWDALDRPHFVDRQP